MTEMSSNTPISVLLERIRLLELENAKLRKVIENDGPSLCEGPVPDSCEKCEDLLVLINATGNGLFSIDLCGKCTFINSKALKLLGYTDRKQLIGKDLLSLINYSLVAYSALDPRHCKIVDAAINQKNSHVVDEFFLRADGTSIPVEYFSSPIKKNGKCIGAAVSFIEITDRKLAENALIESEERFKRYVNSTSDFVYTLDAEQRYIGLYGEQVERMGYIKENFLGKTITEVLGRLAEVHEIANRSALKGQSVVYEWSHKVDGRKLYYQNALSPIYQNSEVVGLIGVGRDITKLVENRRLIMAREIQLKRLNATKDKLFSIIAHDLYNPFNTILGFTQLLKTKLSNKDIAKSETYIEHILGATNNALVLLNNLLDWSKAQTGKLTIEKSLISFTQLSDEVIHGLNSMALLKSITITTEIPSKTDIIADPSLLRTILRNLITNAIKFTDKGGNIMIKAIANDDYVEVNVVDSGVGMDRAVLSRIFHVGAHEAIRGTANEKGSGLGLILCKEFVEMHGGAIWAVSTVGKGSTFKFIIPNKLN